MIAKKGLPVLAKSWMLGRSLHPAGDASLGYIEAQHEELAVNPGSAPGWVFRHHPEDQLPNMRGPFFPTDLFSRLRDPSPVQAKTSVMPANDRLRIDEHERLLPSTPETTDEYPKDFVNRSYPGSGMLALQPPPAVAGERDFPGEGFDAIESSG
jgi:hypothetical protein